MAGLEYRWKGAIYRITVQADDELECVDNWIAATLGDDVTLAGLVADGQIASEVLAEGSEAPEGLWIFGDVAPEGAPEPFIRVWLEAAEDDIHTFDSEGGAATVSALQYGIAGIANNADYNSLTAINKRIRQTLTSPITGGYIETDDGYIIACQRLRPWRQAESQE